MAVEPTQCPRCGTPLSPHQPCPRCTDVAILEGEATRTHSHLDSSTDIEGDFGGVTRALADVFADEEEDASWQLEPGQMVGHCRLEAKLGQGAMGVVYRALHEGLQKVMAVKILPPNFARDQYRVQLFLQEARSAARLDHKNIVRVYDVGKWENFYYLVMEYVEGTDLKEILKKNKKLPPRHAAKVAMEVAEGLAAAHRENIVHRDIKPANIMLARGGIVKISDFGLARPIDAGLGLEEESLVGTPLYMAPECIDGRGADGRSDLYALGVTLYFCLTGQLPIQGTTLAEILIHQVNQTPPDPRSLDSSIPPVLEKITKKLLEKNPDNRYQRAEEVAQDLRQFLEGKQEVRVFVPSEEGRDLTRERILREKAKRMALERRKQQLLMVGVVLAFLLAPVVLYALQPSIQLPKVPLPKGAASLEDWARQKLRQMEQADPSELQRIWRMWAQLFPSGSEFREKGQKIYRQRLATLWKKQEGRFAELLREKKWDRGILEAYQLRQQQLFPLQKEEVKQWFQKFQAKIYTYWQMAFVPKGEVRLPSGKMISVGPFLIDVYEVTNQKFWEYTRKKGVLVAQLPDWQKGRPVAGRELWPVRGVSYYQALEYAESMGRRLPTLGEWLYAATGTEGLAFPYGKRYRPGLANDLQAGRGAPVAVTKLKDVSPFGLRGMAGNVAEWTSTSVKGSNWLYTVGGSYQSLPLGTSPWLSLCPFEPTQSSPYIGFRTVLDLR